MQSASPSSKPLDGFHRPLSLPSHLYNRAGIFYFRLVLTEKLRQRLGCVELRLSLRTAYRRKALDLSRRLYTRFYEIAENDPMISYKELRRRLNLYLQYQLEADYNSILPRPAVDECFSPVVGLPDYIASIAAMLPADPAAGNPDYSEADLCRYRAGIIKEAIKNPESVEMWSELAVKELTKCGLLLSGDITSYDRLRVTRMFLESQIAYYKFLEKRYQGDYLAAEPIVSADFGELPKKPSADEAFKEFLREEEHLRLNKNKPKVAADTIPEKPELDSRPQTKASLLYSEAMQEFIQNKLDENRWKPHMLSEHEGLLKTFLEIMGDMELGQIDRKIMRKYRDILSKFPPNHNRAAKYKGKTASEILEMAPEKVLSPARVNMLIQAISSLMDWFIAEGVLSQNSATKLQQKEDRQVIELRHPFEKKDLEKIFSHPKFALGKFKFADYFWAPLIALFSGMRLEEICQLHCKDVYQDEASGIWVMDINSNGRDEDGYEKTLKNINARRLVPVHKTLIDLGFLRYHEHVSGGNHVRLFPNLNKSDNVGKYGKQVGKQFNDLVKKVLNEPGYSSDGKTFHSLRHNFADFYKQRGWQTDAFRQLYGHDIPELAARQYGSKFPAERLAEVVSALDYEIDFSFLRESKYIKELNANVQPRPS